MTKTYFKFFAVTFCTALLFWACKKNELTVAPYDYADSKALFKINYACAYGKNSSVQLKINDIRVSNNITYATPFPGGGLNTGGSTNADYLAANPGTNTVKLSIPKVGTNEDSVILYETTVELESGIYQTLHIADTTASTQSVLVADAGNKEDSGFVQYRFINLIPNSIGIDLYFGSRKLASNVAYKQITDTFKIASGSTGSWTIRVAGETVVLNDPPYSNTATTVNQRVFTVYARGYLGLDKSDNRSPKVSLLYNK